jgi:LacI family transcriptional regulator
MASMKDVARRAGVSISTVSRVISRKIPVDARTEQKVRAAIRELRYKPNLLASGLRSKSGRAIGLLVPRIADPFFCSLIDHVDRAVISHGYNLLLFNTNSDPDFEEQVIENMLSRRVDGIIFSMVSDESRAMELVSGVDVPVVMLDRVRDTEKLLSLVLDNTRAGRIAAEHLADLGHRRLACITGPQTIHLCIERLNGFRAALEERGIPVDDDCVVEGDFTFSSGVAAASRLAAVSPKVTAIWAQNDLMAAGVMKGMIGSGRRIPENLSIVGMDDVEVPILLQPPLTTIAQPIREMAEKAVEMIWDRMRGGSMQHRAILEPRIVIRESTAPPRGD